MYFVSNRKSSRHSHWAPCRTSVSLTNLSMLACLTRSWMTFCRAVHCISGTKCVVNTYARRGEIIWDVLYLAYVVGCGASDWLCPSSPQSLCVTSLLIKSVLGIQKPTAWKCSTLISIIMRVFNSVCHLDHDDMALSLAKTIVSDFAEFALSRSSGPC